MTTSISVFGLGYVGCVSAACFAKEGHSVTGVDVNPAKVDMINAGKATIVEAGIGELVAEMAQSGRLRATTSVEDAVRETAVSLVCVGTPSRTNGSLDLTYVERVSEQIGAALRNKQGRHVVVIRSTVLPGTIHDVVVPALERTSGKKAGTDFGVCGNPEFLREGTSIRDFYDPPFTLVGADDPETGRVVAGLYHGIDAPVHIIPVRTAEMVKYSCNCFHGLKVAFANEIGNICKAVGVDSHEVMRIFCEDRKLNISPYYLRPGYAFGGSCLPKDLRATVYNARAHDVPVPVLEATLESNRLQIEKAFDMVMATGKKRVGVLGLSFKAGTDDLRESPMVSLIERLIGKGTQLAIYDPYVTSSRLMGANREYIEREIPHIWELMRGSIREVLDASDAVIIGNSAGEFREIQGHLRGDQPVVDLVRAFGPRTSDGGAYQGICW
ncbi:MAG TPA: UDP-glucose/GDP-mannose dehydrogenase family protein [Gemmatimonadales bacterium]|nr:UDP-glucose/GDP-mannose dehydrogenase family protein [Gemmatimonadales bacterium]